MNKTCAKWALGIDLGLLVGIAIPAWVNNVSVALQWDPDQLGKVYRGVLPWFDWAAVDFSTVTTLIPMIGLALIAVGLARICRQHDTLASEHMPFFPGYASFTIASGLIGTVIGLIMYGYYKQDEVKLEDLMICMRTALYSTLIALIWVFYVELWVSPLMRWWYNRTSDAKSTGDRGLIEQLKSLASEAATLTGSFAKASKDLVAFVQNLPHITDTVAKLEQTSEAQKRAADKQSDAALRQSEVAHAQIMLIQQMQTALAQEQANSTAAHKSTKEAWAIAAEACTRLAGFEAQRANRLERRLATVSRAIHSWEGDGHADNAT